MGGEVKYQHDHIHLTTQDVDRRVAFYTDAFGATVTSSVESFGIKMVNLDVGGAPVRISNRTGVEKKLSDERGETVLADEGYHHFGFLVDNIDACVADLVSKGAVIEVEVGQATPTLRCGFLKLPGDVRIEVCQRLE